MQNQITEAMTPTQLKAIAALHTDDPLWKCANYKVLVHAGQLIGQHDAQPGLDGFPTSGGGWAV